MRRFSLNDWTDLTNGRFEIIGALVLHEGNKLIKKSYENNVPTFANDLLFVYNYFKEYSPEAITLTFDEFAGKAFYTLVH